MHGQRIGEGGITGFIGESELIPERTEGRVALADTGTTMIVVTHGVAENSAIPFA